MTTLLFPLSDRQRRLGRVILLAGIVLLWILLGMEEDIFKLIAAAYLQKIASLLSFPDFIFAYSDYATAELTKAGTRIITVVYGLFYCGLGLCIIQLYTMNIGITKICWGLYCSLFLISIVINEAGKIFQLEPFRIVAHRIMATTVSPLPMVLLITVLYIIESQEIKTGTSSFEKHLP